MATAYKDYYQTLGVDKSATQKDIKSAFRNLARKYHPDVNHDPAAEPRFKEVNEANEVLSDPEKRKKYDQLGPEWEAYERAAAAGGMPFGDFGQGAYRGRGGGPRVEYRSMSRKEMEDLFGEADPFSDFFYSVFGNGASGVASAGRGGFASTRSRGRVATSRGEDVQGETSISLEEAYSGTSRTIEMETPGGRRKVEVKIPAGIKDGARVRAAGQGTSGRGGGKSGDLYIRVKIRNHPRFTRVGDDVTIAVEVPLDVALLGGEVEVPTLKGTRVSLKVPPETQNRSRHRLRGLGMPRQRGTGNGDLLAEVDVRLPLPMSPEQRKWAEAYPGRQRKSGRASKDN